MSHHSVAPLAFEFRRYFSSPACPRCGDQLLAAEVSEFLSEGRVRHFWACDSCGQEFHTTVRIAHAALPQSSRRAR